MAFELKQSLKLSQQLVMTPQLQQAIKLLQMTRMELAETVNQELMENPILEEVSELPEGENAIPPEAAKEAGLSPEEQQRLEEDSFKPPTQNKEELMATSTANQDDFNWESYVEDYGSDSAGVSSSMKEIGEEMPSYDSVLTKTTSLEEHLMWQLSMTQFMENEERLGELIIGNLDDDGYLMTPLLDLAQEAEIELEDAEEILKMIQHFDPIGVASRNLQECLMIQAKLMSPRDTIVELMIEKHLPELERKNYQAIAKSLTLTLNQVIEATKVIMEFQPKPGRVFQSNDAHYISPDIYVTKVGDEFTVTLNDEGMPRLRISPYYKNILAQAKAHSHQTVPAGSSEATQSANAAENTSNKNTKDYVQDKLRSAVWLIRSIHNRQKTIFKVTEAIVRRQRDFFEKGVHFLRPMILRDVADDIGMHESTVSRVTTNKFVHTPVGTFELKYFFNSSINSADGSDALASEAVKEKIKQLVHKEDPKRPLSDQQLVDLLKNDNIDIARRTVAKYRDILGILSSGKRKKIF